MFILFQTLDRINVPRLSRIRLYPEVETDNVEQSFLSTHHEAEALGGGPTPILQNKNKPPPPCLLP